MDSVEMGFKGFVKCSKEGFQEDLQSKRSLSLESFCVSLAYPLYAVFIGRYVSVYVHYKDLFI